MKLDLGFRIHYCLRGTRFCHVYCCEGVAVVGGMNIWSLEGGCQFWSGGLVSMLSGSAVSGCMWCSVN